MTEESTSVVLPSTWQTDNVLKYSELERLARGRKAKLLTDQIKTPTQPALKSKTEAQREKIIEDKIKALGVRGEPLFQELSYFKCVCSPQETCIPAHPRRYLT